MRASLQAPKQVEAILRQYGVKEDDIPLASMEIMATILVDLQRFTRDKNKSEEEVNSNGRSK